MNDFWKAIIWRQFGASIDMLENALLACPDELWGERREGPPEFWYLIYHTLFWLDLYLHGSVEVFKPPAPFTLDELDPAGLMPERVYSKEELHEYLLLCRRKCRSTVESLTSERAGERCSFRWGEPSFAELLVYNMRHVQHHAAQLNLMLRLDTDSAPGWVAYAKDAV